MIAPNSLHGLLAEFAEANQVLIAAQKTYAAGYRRIDAYSPFPVEGLAHAIGRKRNLVPFFTLLGGILGGVGGYFMQWYATVIDYPLNIGGRPLHSWPAYIPITFELTILGASLFSVISMIALNRLPQPYHPVFNAPAFKRASSDRFFLCIEAADPKFDRVVTQNFLSSLSPMLVTEVEK